MKFTDKSLMPFGKYKGERMENVPGSYLDWLLGEMETQLESNSKALSNTSADLYNYIIENLDVIQAEARYEHPTWL